MTRRGSIAWTLILGFVLTGLAAAALLLFVVAFDFDHVFDSHYRQKGLTGLAYEIGDHVIVPLVVLLVPMITAVPWVIRRALAPLTLAARRINAANHPDRGIRVDLAGLPKEAVVFVTAVNDLLGRLDEAAVRQEAFAADVAHELKTPLAILGMTLDRDDGPLADEIRAELGAMNRLVDQLLLLAQLDADSVSHAPREAVPLADVALEVCSRLAPLALAAGKDLALEILDRPVVAGRREAVAAALRNLVENAQRFVPEGQAVVILVGPGPQLRVRDEGPGLTREQLDVLQRRHERADRASAGGAGLGMAIVSRIMEAHGGALETDPKLRELRLVFKGPMSAHRVPNSRSPASPSPGTM